MPREGSRRSLADGARHRARAQDEARRGAGVSGRPSTPALPPIAWLLAGLASSRRFSASPPASNWLAPSTHGRALGARARDAARAHALSAHRRFAGPPAVSPDGRSIVFAAVDPLGKRQLWIRRLDSLTPEPLPSTDDGTFPFWSPDSRSIAFFASGRLKRLDLDAGSALALCDALGGRGGAWGPQDVILFSPGVRGGLQQVSASGGTPTPVTSIEGTPFTSHRWPQILPDGRHFVYLAVQQEEGPRSERGLPRLARRAGAAAAVRDQQPGRCSRAGICCSCATRHCGRSHSIPTARR